MSRSPLTIWGQGIAYSQGRCGHYLYPTLRVFLPSFLGPGPRGLLEWACGLCLGPHLVLPEPVPFLLVVTSIGERDGQNDFPTFTCLRGEEMGTGIFVFGQRTKVMHERVK